MSKEIMRLSLCFLALALLIPFVHAEGPSAILTVWTDRPEYSSGQSGKLYVTYNNIRDSPITIHNITIVFPEWWAYVSSGWVGNLTYVPSDADKTITEHTARTFEIGFAVPSDGRARTTGVDLTVYTNLSTADTLSGFAAPTVSVVETPLYATQIITLFTVHVVLLIVCTIIIAAAIFLSIRRPQPTWKPEEKPE
jgi:hypothetical protein